MNISKKYAIGLTSIVLVGTVAIGSVASAAGNDDGLGGRNRQHLTTEQKCAKQDQIAERVATMQQRITDRLASLQEKRAEADAAGDTAKVERLDRRIARIEKLQQRVATRYGTYQTWVSENC